MLTGEAIMKKLNFLVATRVILVLMVLMIPSLLFAGEVVLVANKNVPDNDLAKDEIKAIFLGNKTKWSDDTVLFIRLFGENALSV